MRNQLAVEMISYQVNDSFVKAAEGIVRDIFTEVRKKSYKSSRDLIKNSVNVKKLSILIKDRFNMENEISHDLLSLAPMAVVPYLNIDKTFEGMSGFSFPFFSSFFKAHRKLLSIASERKHETLMANNRKGFVDLKSARVGGYLSEMKVYFIFDFLEMVNENLSPLETVAVMLHEVGHAFVGFECHYLLESSNQTLRQMMIEMNKNDIEKAVYIFNSKAKSKEDMINIKDQDSLTRHDMTFTVYSKYFESIRSQIIDGKYNETSFENMADAFAARFGLGTELASALNKLYENRGKVYTKSAAALIAVLNVLEFLWVLAFVAMLIVTSHFFIAAFILFSVFIGSGQSSKDLTYDVLKDRYQRIRNTMVNQLKSTLFSGNSELTKQLVDGITKIDGFVESTFNLFSTEDYIANNLFPSDRRAKYYYEMQRDLEDLSSNSLFLSAGRISLL